MPKTPRIGSASEPTLATPWIRLGEIYNEDEKLHLAVIAKDRKNNRTKFWLWMMLFFVLLSLFVGLAILFGMMKSGIEQKAISLLFPLILAAGYWTFRKIQYYDQLLHK